MTVKILLKQIREERRLSQNKLAQLMEMSLQNIQRIEYGDAKSIPLETLDKLCEALNCQPGDLLIRVPDYDREQENILIEQVIQRIRTISVNEDDSKLADPSSQNQNMKFTSLLIVNSMPTSA